MAKKRRIKFDDDFEAIGHRHVPKRLYEHTAQEYLRNEDAASAYELTRHLRPRHQEATLMHVEGAKRRFDGRVVL